MYVVNGSDGWCIVAVRLIVGVRYLERPLREVLLYINVCRGWCIFCGNFVVYFVDCYVYCCLLCLYCYLLVC